MEVENFCLKWNSFQRNIVTALENLQSCEDLVDVTLMCEGRNVKAHKVMLSACSMYFRDMFKENPCQHPVVILKGVLYDDLKALLEFIYKGEVMITQDRLQNFLSTAELLEISGLVRPSECDDRSLKETSPEVVTPKKKKTENAENSSTRAPKPNPSCAYKIDYRPAIVDIKTELEEDEDCIIKDSYSSNSAEGDSSCSTYPTYRSSPAPLLVEAPHSPPLAKRPRIAPKSYSKVQQSTSQLSRRVSVQPPDLIEMSDSKEGVLRIRRMKKADRTNSKSRKPVNCPNCGKLITQARNLPKHLKSCQKRSNLGKPMYWI